MQAAKYEDEIVSSVLKSSVNFIQKIANNVILSTKNTSSLSFYAYFIPCHSGLMTLIEDTSYSRMTG
jgi:hypothetical protein